jgi:hypothetical protein
MSIYVILEIALHLLSKISVVRNEPLENLLGDEIFHHFCPVPKYLCACGDSIEYHNKLCK